jgi:hypothetical protein
VKEWIVLAVTAVGGSIVGSAATLYVDQRKRRDEKRNRDRDKKQQAYTQYAQFASMLFHELMLMADVQPIVSQIGRGTTDQADLEELHAVTTRFNAYRENLEECMSKALYELVMIAPKDVRGAAIEVLGACVKLAGYMKLEEDDAIEAAEETFNRLIYEFRVAARLDLGIEE